MLSPVYEIQNLTKTFGKDDSLTLALDCVSIKIKHGELVAITGPSGCGKTTLLNVLSGLIQPTEGKVYFEASNIFKWTNKELSLYRNQSIGYVMQNFGLINTLSVLNNILLPIKRRVERKKCRAIALSNLERLGIKEKKNSRPFELSGGQKQRVAIARALINNPKVLLADEPTGALDSESSQMIMDIFKTLHQQGFTVILVTHQEELAKQCERIIQLQDGRIISDTSKL